MRRVKIGFSIIFFIALHSGCATAPKGDLKEVKVLEDGQGIATDARLRMITHMKPGIASRPGRVDPNVITCTEPGPIVAAALASSFGFGISVLNYGSASLSGSQAEAIAQLAERTTAIQALLHQGYQACLDYANGAITGTTYSLRTSRLDDLLVTLILGEVAGGAFGRTGAAIGLKANAEAQAKLVGFPEMLKDIDKAKAELDAAQQKVKEKDDAYKAADKAYTDATDADPKKNQLKAERDAKKAELDAANVEKNAIIQKLSVQIDTTSKSASEVSQLIAMGGLTPKHDADTAKILGEMHKTFIEKDIEQAYISACLIELGGWKLQSSEDRAYLNLSIDQISEFKKQALKDKEKEGLNNERKDLSQWVDAVKSRPFFLASSLNTKGTLLSEHCVMNLEKFISKAQDNRYALKFKTLEIETKKLDLAKHQIAEDVKMKEAIFPQLAYNLLSDDLKILAKKKSDLSTKTMPSNNEQLAKEKKGLIEKADVVISEGNSLITDNEKAKIDKIEQEYVALMKDTRKTGTESEKKLWTAEYNLYQAKSEAENNKLQDHSKKVKEAAREIDDFFKKIEAINKII